MNTQHGVLFNSSLTTLLSSVATTLSEIPIDTQTRPSEGHVFFMSITCHSLSALSSPSRRPVDHVPLSHRPPTSIRRPSIFHTFCFLIRLLRSSHLAAQSTSSSTRIQRHVSAEMANPLLLLVRPLTLEAFSSLEVGQQQNHMPHTLCTVTDLLLALQALISALATWTTPGARADTPCQRAMTRSLADLTAASILP